MKIKQLVESEQLAAALIGGLVSSVLAPLIRFFFLQWYNRRCVSLRFEKTELIDGYTGINIGIRNNSSSTLKDVHVYVTIDSNEQDKLRPSTPTCVYSSYSTGKVDYAMLSWAKIVDNRNLPEMNLHHQEEHMVNFLRIHGGIRGIEVASEQGFHDIISGVKPRIYLVDRDYNMKLHITGENMFRKQISIK